MMKKTPNEYYKNRLTPPKAFFEWCYSQMPTYVWKNKQKTIIASDRKHEHVVEKRLTKKSRLTFFDRKEIFEIILSTNKRIERQFYQVFSFFDNGKQSFEVNLLNLHVFSENEYIKIHRESEDNYLYGLKPVVGMFNYYYAQPVRYDNNWKDRLEKVSELKYLKLENMSDDLLEWYYRYRDRLEFIQKIGAKGLEKQFNQGTLDFRIVTLNWLKKVKVIIRKSDYKFEFVHLKDKLEQAGGKMVEGIESYLKGSEVKKLPKQVGVVKFQNYLIKQRKAFWYYQDYLNALIETGQEITNKRIVPQDLVKAHDEAVKTLNAMKREIVRKEFEVRKKKLSAMELVINGYVFVLPSSANELMEEGKALEHCVGNSHYINEHAEGKTTIVFVRKKEKINESYFTIEYKEKSIVQLHSTKNDVPVPEELKKATDQWVKRVNQLKEKGGQQVG